MPHLRSPAARPFGHLPVVIRIVLLALLAAFVVYKLAFSRENLGWSTLAHRTNMLIVVLAGSNALLLLVGLVVHDRTHWTPLFRASVARWLFEVVVIAAIVAIACEPHTSDLPVNLFRLQMLAWLLFTQLFVMLGKARLMVERAAARRWFRSLDLAVFNLCVLAVLLEIGARAMAFATRSPLNAAQQNRVLDRLDTYRLQPGSSWFGSPVNSLGFVDREFTRPKPAGTFRIIALGDSFAVGVVPYERNYLTLLESHLDRGPGAQRAIDVLNFGICGISPVEYAYLLRTEGLEFEPDLILVNVFVGNDFTECEPKQMRFAERFASVPMLRNLSLVWGEWARGSASESPTTLDHWRDDFDRIPSFTESAFHSIERERLEVCRVPEQPLSRSGIDVALRALEEIAGLVQGRVALVVIPDEFQVDASLLATLVAANHLEASSFDLARPQRLLAEFAARHDMPLIDLLPMLRQATQNGERVYKPRDTHWNLAGNALAAQAIAEALTPVIERMRRQR